MGRGSKLAGHLFLNSYGTYAHNTANIESEITSDSVSLHHGPEQTYSIRYPCYASDTGPEATEGPQVMLENMSHTSPKE